MTPRAIQIRQTVARVFGVTEAEILGSSRPQHIADARMASMALCCRAQLGTTTQIAREHCRRDHTSVVHATVRVAELRESDQEFRRKWNEAEKALVTA